MKYMCTMLITVNGGFLGVGGSRVFEGTVM